jgi:multisubunit Na+/H+ antiporter MnhC subunit
MKRIEVAGTGLIIFALLVLTGYALFMFVQATEVPAIIRLGIVALAVGFLVILLSVIRERLLDLQREKPDK